MTMRARRRRSDPDAFLCLPFISMGENGPVYWAVETTEDPRMDSERGRDYALEYIAWQEWEINSPGLLQLIVGDMPRELGWLENSFLEIVGEAAGGGPRRARAIVETERMQAAQRRARRAA